MAGQKDGLQDREECLCEEMAHTHLLCLPWKIKIPAKMSAQDEALVLETRGKWKRSCSQRETKWLEIPDGMSLFTPGAWWLESRREVCKDKGQTGRTETSVWMSSSWVVPFEVKNICGYLAPAVAAGYETACHPKSTRDWGIGFAHFSSDELLPHSHLFR